MKQPVLFQIPPSTEFSSTKLRADDSRCYLKLEPLGIQTLTPILPLPSPLILLQRIATAHTLCGNGLVTFLISRYSLIILRRRLSICILFNALLSFV